MQVQLTKEQQDAVDRIKVEGDFDELYYDGPLRRGRVVVRCEGMAGGSWFNDVERLPLGVAVVNGRGGVLPDLDAITFKGDYSNYTYVDKCDTTIAATQIITPYAAELDWSGVYVDQEAVDVAACILARPDGPKDGSNDVGSVFFWSTTPQGRKWWQKQDGLYNAGTLTPELREALESYLTYAAGQGVTPAQKDYLESLSDLADAQHNLVERRKVSSKPLPIPPVIFNPPKETLAISLDDLRSIVQYGFDPSKAKMDAFMDIVKGVSV